MMRITSNLLLVSTWLSLAFAERGTESGGGIAPWAGTGPLPPQNVTPARPQHFALASAAGSSVPFGTIITTCTVPNTFAITFDDGPYIYTAHVLDILKAAGVRATFFVNGDNWQQILSDSGKALAQRTVAEGHQIGSHT